MVLQSLIMGYFSCDVGRQLRVPLLVGLCVCTCHMSRYAHFVIHQDMLISWPYDLKGIVSEKILFGKTMILGPRNTLVYVV